MNTAAYDEYAQTAEPQREPDHVTRAVMLCKNPEFWHYLERRRYYVWGVVDEKQATHILRELIGVESRRELATSADAQAKLEKILEEVRALSTGTK